ncbi:hypothetical protein M2116_000567 [Aurantimicrobium minutum]|uniref:hypothetical protein n=1 Tax=Aurantimicrobium minutum TaxID=708131 RepID=UPI00240544C2|nr:hypothetical protein [Aurantimicrobium minutum]MDF9809623.1 hypothetical protein [Aurantimicrobium minutum]
MNIEFFHEALFDASHHSGGTIAVVAGVIATIVVGSLGFVFSQSPDLKVQQHAASSGATATAAPTQSQKPTATPSVEDKSGEEQSPQQLEQNQTRPSVRSDGAVSSPQSSASSGASTPSQSSSQVVAPSISPLSNAYQVACYTACDYLPVLIIYSEPFPEATGTGPLTYSMTGLPTGASFNAVTRKIEFDSATYLNAYGAQTLVLPLSYTATGPGGSMTRTCDVIFSVGTIPPILNGGDPSFSEN